MKRNNLIGLVIALIVIVSAIWYFKSIKNRPEEEVGDVDIGVEDVTASNSDRIMMKSAEHERAKELVEPDGYINVDSINISKYIGKKVILVDFWTYSCINCQRTTPYLNAWYDKYEDDGLLIIGVHTPEFEFEKEYDNVLAAVEREGIKYPVVLDNSYKTWRAYNNRYWPRKYLIDIDGFIVYDHIGEGAYDETEEKIKELLVERAEVLGVEESMDSGLVNSEGISVDFSLVKSPKTYFGAGRNDNFGNGIANKMGVQELSLGDALVKNKFYLTGMWNIADEYAESLENGSIIFAYESKNAYFVASADNPVQIKVYVDDVMENELEISAEKLYTLVEGDDYGERLLRIELPQGLKAYTFTFG